MRDYSLIVFTILLVAHSSFGYNAYPRNSYTASASATASVSLNGECCAPDQWTYNHRDEVKQFADRLRSNYMSLSSGSNFNKPWSANIVQLTGKGASELDALAQQVSEQIVMDLRKGALSYDIFRQPNFFEWQAAKILRSYSMSTDYGQQQQQQLDFNQFGTHHDFANYDQLKNYNYPTEVKVIDGKSYVVRTNVTEASKNLGDGVTIRQRNRTTIASSNTPTFVSSFPDTYANTASLMTHKKTTLKDWYRDNVEPDVADYKPVWNSYNSNMNTGFNNDVERLGSSTPNLYRPNYVYNKPASTVTVHRYNKTIIKNSDGTNREYGSELNRKWIDGKLVYDSERPFGQWTIPKDEQWKREERERFFWFLAGQTTLDKLEAWQRQQEERLIGLAERYHTTLDEIYAWHRKELERYNVLLHQYQAQTTDYTSWKRAERGRLDWLIHQNSVTPQELERWQIENFDKLNQLARQYRISVNDLKNWQIEELKRLYTYFNDQNNSMISRPAFNSESLRQSEQARLEELIRQHNSSIEQLHNSIKTDQQRLADLSKSYRGNVQDMEKWLHNELDRLKEVLSKQHNEMERITSWQRTERIRMENILKQHRGSVEDLESKMALDRKYMQSLASRYKVSIEELENWQRAELQRLQNESQQQFNLELKDWQKREREHLKSIISKNDLTIEDFQAKIINDRARLQELANTYKIQVSEIEDWIKQEIKTFQNEGLLMEVAKELELWQLQERERLEQIVQQNAINVEELVAKIKKDQAHMYSVANKYQVGVDEVEKWLKEEVLRLQSEGLIKAEDLKEWQRQEREDILKIVHENKLTVAEFEKKLLNDRARLSALAQNYNIQTSELELWIKKEGERLQNLGMLQMREELNSWQEIERERLLNLINKNNLSIGELEEKLSKDQVHLYSVAQQHQVRVEEIEAWIKAEIKKLQQEGLIEMEKLKDWQTEWRGNLTNMVKERDFTVEEFHKWLLEDRTRLQALAMQHNVQIEEIEQWIQNEEQRFVSMGLLKPNEKLTNWQEVERRYLERITQDQYHSTEQLEQRLREDRELLQKIAGDYSVQVVEIEKWMKKELARLRDEGQLQIDNLTAWQIAERERLEQIAKQNKQWTVEEFEAELNKDREHMQRTAFQYHTSVEEVENWLKSEVERLQIQGKLNIDSMTAWQKAEHKRIINLLQQQSSVTAEEFEQRLQQDRRFINNLAQQYHVGVTEIEAYVKQVLEDLRLKGRFELEKLQTWQIVERDYIKQLISQHKNDITTAQYEQKLRNDNLHLQQLAQQYHLSVEEIEKWMINEVRRLRSNSEGEIQTLAAWQQMEAQRLKDLIKQNSHLSYLDFEVELMKEGKRIQELSKQYSLSVEQVEDWLRQQLLNLKTTGEIEVENLTQWQKAQQKHLIEMLLQEQKMITEEEFEAKLSRDHAHLQALSQTHSVDVHQIEDWMRNELQRLKESGLLQVEELTQWQRQERDRLQNWLQQQQQVATYEDFNDFLRRDKERLANIASDYQLAVEEVESWVQQEGARLQVLGHLKRPQSYVNVNEYEYKYNSNQGYANNAEQLWKEQTRAHLKYFIDVGQIHNLADVERYIQKEQGRLQNFARQYEVPLEAIETWLRQESEGLVQQGIIQGEVIEETWQSVEREHIDNLINERLRKQQQWSTEELERYLVNDQIRLQQLANQYHKTVEEIEIWYKSELQRLLEQRKVVSEHLVDWQRREKDRLYRIVTHTPNLTQEQLRSMVLNDRNTLNHLADTYHVNIEELEIWIRNEINRLQDLELLKEHGSIRRWQEEERKRLKDIAVELIITEEEILEYISNDADFQQHLSRTYGISPQALAPFQRIEISVMQREGLFDNTQLLKIINWQKIERDRLYKLIKTQNLSLKNLQNWQRQETLQELATKYDIAVEDLKNWQLKEYERIQQIADYYHMTMQQLAAFREQELSIIDYAMHKNITTIEERARWSAQEQRRTAALERKSGVSGQKLLEWRRRLYLLSQALIPLEFGGYGGYETGNGSTNRTGAPYHEISKDRGDQPPTVYEEEMDVDEPGVLGENYSYGEPPAQISQSISSSTERQVAQAAPAVPAVPAVPAAQINSEGGYRYSKKEIEYNVPLNEPPSRKTREQFNKGPAAEEGQQQQVEIDDFGQQQQQEEELAWNGQQQVQLGDLKQENTQQQQEELGQTQLAENEFNVFSNSKPAPQKSKLIIATTETVRFDKQLITVFH